VAPGRGLDVGGLDEDCADGEGLDEHFYFSGGDGAEVDTFCLGGVAEDGYEALPDNQDGGDGPADYMQGNWRPVEEGFRLADYGKANESAADEDLIDEGVEHTSEFGIEVQFSCDGAVDDVGKSRDDKNHKSSVYERSSVAYTGEIKEHTEEKDGKDEPAKGQNVW